MSCVYTQDFTANQGHIQEKWQQKDEEQSVSSSCILTDKITVTTSYEKTSTAVEVSEIKVEWILEKTVKCTLKSKIL